MPTATLSAEPDRRYEHVTCPACHQQWQRIDYRSALHVNFCPAPEPATQPRPTALERELAREAAKSPCECGRRGCSAWPECLLDFFEPSPSDADPGL